MLVQGKLKNVIFDIKNKSEFNNCLELQKNVPEITFLYITEDRRLEEFFPIKEVSLFIGDDADVLLEAKTLGFLCVPTMGAEADYGFEYVVDNLADNTRESLEGIFLRLKGEPWIIAETQRCLIREITVEDVPALYDIYDDERVTKYTDRLYERREDEIVYTKEYIRTYYRFYEYGMWVVTDRLDGRVIGRAGLEPLDDRVELGYVIAGPLQGMGYGSEVCEAVMKIAEEILPEQAIYARCHIENIASKKILKKLGFRERDYQAADGQIYVDKKKEESVKYFIKE